jgi:Arc/MetJ-type ribon-helix-helix transcriptional regulator
MVYSDVVGRTQVYLGEEELELLDLESRRTGASRSELIRRAIRRTYGEELTKEERLRRLHEAAGIWKDRPFTGAEYVDMIRGDLNERLRRLGFD